MRDEEFEVLVRSLRLEAADVLAVELEPLPGATLPAAGPGDHVDVVLPSGVRQYSLCNGPGEGPGYRIAVKLEARSRGGSRYVHRTLRPGDRVRIRGPRSNFALVDDAPDSVLLAGGIGVTPIASMARHLAHRAHRFTVHYFCQSDEHVVFADLWRRADMAARTELHLGLDPAATAADVKAILADVGPETRIYLCGPAGFMAAVESAGEELGIGPDRVHLERFGAAPVLPTSGDGGFAVLARRSGVEVEVGAEETVVAALARAGVEVDVSCEQGLCGTCDTPVVEGTIDHRDDYLTDEEKAAQDRMCLCVSRAGCPRLVLDL